MSSRSNKKNLQAKLQKYNEIREGKDALDSLDFDEENVFDELDEDEYGKRAEAIREASFVVDDDGLGYGDDGEEHLFDDAEDDLGKRARTLEERDAERAQKKSKKLVEALAASKQTNTIKGFLKSTSAAGVKPASREVIKEDVDALDADSFFTSVPSTTGRPAARPGMAVGGRGVPALQRSQPQLNRHTQPNMNRSAPAYVSAYSTASDGNNESESYYDDEPVETSYGGDHNDKETDVASKIDNHFKSPEPVVASNSHNSMDLDSSIKTEPSSAASASVPVPTKMPQLKTSKKITLADIEDAKPPIESGLDDKSAIGGGGGGAKLDPSKWLFTSTAATAIKPEAFSADGLDNSMKSDGATASGETFVKMFWMDAFEKNGTIYLFGKIALVDNAPPVSGCLAVHGCQRNLFVLPRIKGDSYKNNVQERFAINEVYDEMRKVLQGVIPNQQGSGFKCKPVKRSYVFECGDVPRGELDYLKITYSAKFGVPNQNICTGGGKTFQRIFGSGSTALEWFLLKRELMGPCWIQVKSPKPITDNMSWCKVEMSIDDPKSISKLRNPPQSPFLTSLSLSMKTVVNPSTHVHEIIAISGMIHNKVDADAETDENPKYCRRFTYIRQLNQSCGPNFPSVFPHDFAAKAKQTGYVQTFANERAMLSRFFTELSIVDPDIITSHNLYGFEFEILLNRAVEWKVPDWSRLGRVRRAQPPRPTDRDLTPGRVLCDTYKSAKEFLRETSYSLTSLVKSQLGFDRVEIDPVDVPRYFASTESLLDLAEITNKDAWLVQKLMNKLQVVPLTKQLTVVAGNLWSRTLRGGKAERNEYLLLHQFHNGIYGAEKKVIKYILPEKKQYGDNAGSGKGKFKEAMEEDDDDDAGAKVGGMGRKRAKAAYAGGLVLEPKKGLYDNYILLLDFNSLYPSIIQEYNLCFTTIDWTKYMPTEEKKEGVSDASTPSKDKKAGGASVKAASAMVEGDDDTQDVDGDNNSDDDDNGDANSGNKALPPIPDKSTKGVLPRVIKDLVDRRKEVKKLLKDAKDVAEKQSLDIRQKAYKLTANSMYGCLGFSFSRFYARPIAALVTAMGREALQRTVEQAESKMGYTVIYGDTDSVMINTNCTDLALAKEIGIKIRQEVNKMYSTLELDTDGIFKSMLLLKKKKYAALAIKEGKDGSVTYEAEMKGLDLVRRDWCPLSKETGVEIVNQILSGRPREEIVMAIHEYLNKLQETVRSNGYDLSKYVITKGLNKNPKDYPDVKGQPHLQVALAMLKANKPVNIGDHIPYVICKEGEEGSSHVARAHHPDEIERSEGKLTVDFEWYLTSQILPPVQRLCEPIEGTSPSILATQLGLDASKFHNSSRSNDDDEWGFGAAKCYMDDAERFAECEPLMITCRACAQESPFAGLSTDAASGVGSLTCTGCNARYYGYDDTRGLASYISNRITLLVRHCQKMYYECWLRCDDPTCGRRTMQQSTRGFDRCTENCHGKMEPEYSDVKMYNQIKYLQSLFDIDRLTSRAAIIDTPEMKQKVIAVKNFNEKQISFFKDVKGVITQLVESSGYNWILPSIWTLLRNSTSKM